MGRTDQDLTLRAIDEIQDSTSVDDVVIAYTSFVNGFGFETVAITQLVNPARAGQNRLVITNWPEEYVKDRHERNTIAHDPIVLQAIRSKTPFTWQDVYQRTDKNGRKIIDEGRDFTQNDGLLIPIHVYDSIPGCITIGTNKLSLSQDQIRWIDVVSIQAYMKIVDFMGPFPFEVQARLSNREIDVVHYAAAGKTNWEISKILGISEHTVRAYFQTAAQKLKTVSRTHTIAVAIAQGYVLA